LSARCPRFFHHHLLAMQFLNSCNAFLVKVLVLIHSNRGGIHYRIAGLVLCWLRGRSSWHFEAAICTHHNVLFSPIRFRADNWGLFVRGRCGALRNFGRIDSVIVVAVVGPWIGVLIKVHQDVLNLSLLRWRHNHDDRGCIMLRCHKAWCRSAGHRLMTYKFALCEVIVRPGTSIMSIECLGIWTSSSLFASCLEVVSCGTCSQKASSSSSRGLTLWGSLWLLTLVWLESNIVRISVLRKISLSGILLVILVSMILWLSKLQTTLNMLFKKLLT
jgi:hypothetical protein